MNIDWHRTIASLNIDPKFPTVDQSIQSLIGHHRIPSDALMQSDLIIRDSTSTELQQQQDKSGTAAGQPPDSNRTTAGQQQDSSGTTAGQHQDNRRTCSRTAAEQQDSCRATAEQQRNITRTTAEQHQNNNRTAAGQQQNNSGTTSRQPQDSSRTTAGRNQYSSSTAIGQHPAVPTIRDHMYCIYWPKCISEYLITGRSCSFVIIGGPSNILYTSRIRDQGKTRASIPPPPSPSPPDPHLPGSPAIIIESVASVVVKKVNNTIKSSHRGRNWNLKMYTPRIYTPQMVVDGPTHWRQMLHHSCTGWYLQRLIAPPLCCPLPAVEYLFWYPTVVHAVTWPRCIRLAQQSGMIQDSFIESSLIAAQVKFDGVHWTFDASGDHVLPCDVRYLTRQPRWIVSYVNLASMQPSIAG